MTTEHEDPVIAEFHRQLDEIENRRKSMTGPCKECKFHDYVNYFSSDECKNPILVGAELNLVTGKVEHKKKLTCEHARRSKRYCGPDGKYFVPEPPPPPPEPKPPKRTLWERLWYV